MALGSSLGTRASVRLNHHEEDGGRRIPLPFHMTAGLPRLACRHARVEAVSRQQNDTPGMRQSVPPAARETLGGMKSSTSTPGWERSVWARALSRSGCSPFFWR